MTNFKNVTTRKIAEFLSDKSPVHTDIVKKVEKLISDNEFFTELKDGYFKSKKSNAKFIQTTYTTSRNNTYKMYEMNEEGFMLLVMQLSKFKKAIILQQKFINASQEMRRIMFEQQEIINDKR